jgi:hypothetical protein
LLAFAGPIFYGVKTIPGEAVSGVIKQTSKEVGIKFLTYLSGLSFVGGIYKLANLTAVKNVARFALNIGFLTITCFSCGF